MRNACLLVLLLLGTMGCEKVQQFVQSAPPSPPKDYIVEWKKVAKERQFYWFIKCLDWVEEGDACAYGGRVWQHQGGDAYYAEDGGEAVWWECGRTQQEVAMNLLAIVAGPPNFGPHYRDEDKRKAKENHRQCLPPLVGSPETAKP